MLQIEPLGPYYMKESKLKLKDANRDPSFPTASL